MSRWRGEDVTAVPVGPLLANAPELLCRSGAQLLLLLFLLFTQ